MIDLSNNISIVFEISLLYKKRDKLINPAENIIFSDTMGILDKAKDASKKGLDKTKDLGGKGVDLGKKGGKEGLKLGKKGVDKTKEALKDEKE